MRVLRTIFVFLGLTTVVACSAPQHGPVPVLPQTTTPILNIAASVPVEDMSGLERSFTVYFDHDSDEIRASAMQVLWEAAQVATKLQPATIRVNGFTDGRGSRLYNQKLSDRRAAAVAAQLVKLNVRVAVVTKGHGSGWPAVKVKGTAKEARNRRVELTFEAGHAVAPESLAAAAVESADQVLSMADVLPLPPPYPPPRHGLTAPQCPSTRGRLLSMFATKP